MSIVSRALCYRRFYSTSNLGVNRVNMKKVWDKTRREEDNEILKSLLKNPKINSTSDLDNLRNEVLNSNGNFSAKNVDRILLNYFIVNGKYGIGLNYIKHLDEEKKSKLNLFLTNQTFRLYFQKRHKEKGLSESEEEHLITSYENLRKSFPALDVVSLENAVLALSVTREWKKCFDLVGEIKKIDKPSSICYNAVTAAAFLNNEEETARMLFEEMFEKDRQPYDVIFEAYIEKLEAFSDKQKVLLKLEELFQVYAEKDIIISERVALQLHKLLSKIDISTKCSSVNKRGWCTSCQEQLNNLELTNETFDKFKEKIVNNVIVGKNIFSKTTPDEFTRFQKFLKTVDNYDVVIDGLNVAYAAGTQQSTQVYSTLLAHVVSHFVNKEKKVVVLGRVHMSKWPNQIWKYIQNNARIFLTQDTSQDDPYLLCCALHCGKETLIVSKDLMRSHLFLLKDPKEKVMFSRWLTQRLYQLSFVTNDGTVHFKDPLTYTTTMQKNGNNWHIPYNSYKDHTCQEKNEGPTKWLCIQCSK